MPSVDGPLSEGTGTEVPCENRDCDGSSSNASNSMSIPLCDGFQGKHPVPVSILRSKNRLSRETATHKPLVSASVSGASHHTPPTPHWTPLPETFLTPRNSSTAPICEIRNGHRRVKQLNVDTQQESLPLSTHAKDRGDTARRSLRELHISVGNRKPGSRALFCLWGSPFPHLSWKPGPAAVFRWVEG